jgi:hypothetical protein
LHVDFHRDYGIVGYENLLGRFLPLQVGTKYRSDRKTKTAVQQQLL